MSLYGESIIESLPLHSPIRKQGNPMHQIINNTVGEWLDHYDLIELFKQLFIQDATGLWLDVHGRQYNVKRKEDEDDESYRQRIIYEMLGHLTTYYLRDVYGVELYTNPSTTEFIEGVTLVSDNPYLCNSADVDGFLGETDNVTESILDKKFVLDEAIQWL